MDFRENGKRMEPLSLFSQSSLTDIVLLLLIFFLLTSSFVTNFGIKVNIPEAEAGAQTDSQFINVAVTKDGEFFVNGELTEQGRLASILQEEKSKNPESTLVLRADKDAIVDNAVRVMNVAQALQLNIMMATEQTSQ